MKIETIEDAYNICEVCSNKPTLKLTTKWGVNFFCESCFDKLQKLEKPKKKIKKWQWENNILDIVTVTKEHYTPQEIRHIPYIGNLFTKIPESEIEVEVE